MEFNVSQLIDKKASRKELEKEEIAFLVNQFTQKNIPDYQMSAFLMAVKLNGMSDKELIDYTECLINSGDVITLPFESCDKHSTGGVGDKT